MAASDGAAQTETMPAPECPHSLVDPLNPSSQRQWKPTALELKHIVAQHRGSLAVVLPLPPHDQYLERVSPAYPDWKREAAQSPKPANLCNADLQHVDLRGAMLFNANMRGADLRNADLRDADLQNADLTGAIMSDAQMDNAVFSYAHMSGASLNFARMPHASLSFADLGGADLQDADLTKAVVGEANLRNANLTGVNLGNAYLVYSKLNGATMDTAHIGGAHLAFADLTNVLYAPDEAPDANVIGIVGLSTLRVPFGEQAGLVQLRKLLQDAGLRDQEREATYSIEHSTTIGKLQSWPNVTRFFEGVFRLVAFEWTTGYGLFPGRALALIVILGALLIPVYFVAIRFAGARPSATTGIYQVFPADRIADAAAEPTMTNERRVVRVQGKGWEAIAAAAYFSLLSAVNIGFEQFTPGDWIRRLQRRDYTLQAVGWVRVVAGAQALLSVFLLAMWALTYFGRPFQ